MPRSKAKVQLLGANELIAKFKELDSRTATDYLTKSLQAGAEVIYDAMARAAPVDTGTLRSAIQIREVERSRNRVVWGIFIGGQAWYWKFLNYGTRYIVTPSRFITRSLKNRRSTARQTIRDTFRDLMSGFK